MASLVFSKPDLELFGFESYELAELVARYTSERVVQHEKFYINVATKKGAQHKAFWFITKMKTDKSEEGYWLAGEFFNS